MVIGENIVSFSELPSTNKYAVENINKLPAGSIVWALKQSAGYGRFKRDWSSPEGGIWFSVVFKPTQLQDPNIYTKLLSVSVAEILQEIGFEARIKWPNDILIDDKKVAGILTQTVFAGRELRGIVVGVGLNVSNPIPEELKERATNLTGVNREDPIPSEVFSRIIRKTESLRKKYMMKRMQKYLTRRWKKNLAQREGQETTVSLNSGEKITGVIIKIAPGSLILCDEEGKQYKINCGEITF